MKLIFILFLNIEKQLEMKKIMKLFNQVGINIKEVKHEREKEVTKFIFDY